MDNRSTWGDSIKWFILTKYVSSINANELVSLSVCIFLNLEFAATYSTVGDWLDAKNKLRVER